MIEDVSTWQCCLVVSAIICGVIKAFIVAYNPTAMLMSEQNSFQNSEHFIVRFLYDFIWSFTNVMYLLCIVLPVGLVMYGISRFFI